eukprot:316598-Hanusia_phi.AAC.1
MPLPLHLPSAPLSATLCSLSMYLDRNVPMEGKYIPTPTCSCESLSTQTSGYLKEEEAGGQDVHGKRCDFVRDGGTKDRKNREEMVQTGEVGRGREQSQEQELELELTGVLMMMHDMSSDSKRNAAAS